MKLNSILAASLFALAAVLSLDVGAAADAPAGAKNAPTAAGDAAVSAKNASDDSTGAKADDAARQAKMRPHSHFEEKTGFAQRVPETVPDRPNPARDFSKHFHPRDGK